MTPLGDVEGPRRSAPRSGADARKINANRHDSRAHVARPRKPLRQAPLLIVGALVVVLVVVVVASVLVSRAAEQDSTESTDGRTQVAAAQPSNSPIRATLELPQQSLPAGSTMEAIVVVQNDTGAAQSAFACNGAPYVAVLVGDELEQQADRLLCRTPIVLPAGESRWPVLVVARYLSCSNSPTTTTMPVAEEPRCGEGAMPMPPLRPGEYKVVVTGPAESIFPSPKPVSLHIT